MRISFATSGSLEDFSKNYTGGADLILFSFQALGEVSYERELKGETSLFEDVALLSKASEGVVMCGCYTDARGIRRKSVVVAEKGRILGVSDMVNRIDVIVAEDLYFPRVAETLSVCGAELAVCIFEELDESLEQILMRAQAFCFGIPMCMCAYGYAQAADIGGKLRYASPKNGCVYEFEREQEFHLVETRQRGFYRKKKTGF